MKFLLVFVAFCELIQQSYCATCAECTAAYEATVKNCATFTTYMQCLEIADTCPLAAGKAAALSTAYDSLDTTCQTSFTETCSCQISYWRTDLSSGNAAAKCIADKALMACLKGKTQATCIGAAAHEFATNYTMSCTVEDTTICSCEVAYAQTDIREADKKCEADKTFFNCLKGKTALSSCLNQGLNTIASGHSFVETCPTDTCTCLINYLKADIVADKCSADKTFITCLKGKTAASCNASTTASDEAAYANVDVSCIPDDTVTDACASDKQYALQDLTTVDKCTADKEYLMCLALKTTPICDGRTAYAAASSHPITCTLTDTCTCQANLAKTDPTDTCQVLKTAFNCLTPATEVGCNGTQTNAVVASDIATAILAQNPACTYAADTTACKCELDNAIADSSTTELKCTADKDFFTCMKGKTEVSCGDKAVHTFAAEHTVADTCPTGTCNCVIEYLRKDRTTVTDKCTADKAFVTCMKGKLEKSCDGTTTAQAEATFPQIQDTCIPVATTTDACSCDRKYIEADLVADKCTADREFLMCLKDKTTTICDGRAADVVARNHPIDNTCYNAFTDTCKCEVELAKRDVASNANKCGAYKAFLSCLRQANGTSCDGTKTAKTAADDAYAILIAIPDNCQISQTCACEISHARNAITDDTTKCSADNALVHCLRNETDSGCVPSNTVASLVDFAARGNCARTKACECEMNYVRGVKTTDEGHCRNAKQLLGCVFGLPDTETTCNGESKQVLQGIARSLITEIPNCNLDDTCACEEVISEGSCIKLKEGISCLRNATSRGCDGVKIVKTLAEETNAKIAAVQNPVCELPAACTCEVTYTSADVSTDAKRCEAARTMKDCMSTAKTQNNGVDLKVCDDKTLISVIDTEMDNVIAKCGTMQCCIVSVTTVLLAALTAHLAKN